MTNTLQTNIAPEKNPTQKTNMERQNGNLEDVFPFLMGAFQVPL